jgi:hypothetical protein
MKSFSFAHFCLLLSNRHGLRDDEGHDRVMTYQTGTRRAVHDGPLFLFLYYCLVRLIVATDRLWSLILSAMTTTTTTTTTRRWHGPIRWSGTCNNSRHVSDPRSSCRHNTVTRRRNLLLLVLREKSGLATRPDAARSSLPITTATGQKPKDSWRRSPPSDLWRKAFHCVGIMVVIIIIIRHSRNNDAIRP